MEENIKECQQNSDEFNSKIEKLNEILGKIE